MHKELKSMSPKLRDELLKQMDALSPEQQERVLSFARTLSADSDGVPGRSLLGAAGRIGQSDLNLMVAAIEEGCERIDQSEW